MASISGKKVIIVGGGPSGAAAAKAMADRGYQVHLFEAYPHPSSLNKTSSKAYVIALSPRGQLGIQNATGIDPVTSLPGGVPSTCMARHGGKKGKAARLYHHDDMPSLIIPRQALTAGLLDAAEASGVSVHFQQRLEDVDFEKRLATFVSSVSDHCTDTDDTETEKTTQVISYDLLIGADGCNSKVRNLMVKNLPEYTVRTEQDSMEYQVVVLPNSPLPLEDKFPLGTVHSWNNKEYNAICLGFPLTTDDNAGMLLAVVFPEGKLASFRNTGYRQALENLLPDVVESNFSEIEKQLRENQIATGGLCVWSSCLGSDTVILLGDSGHGMWPSLGQGANCALESVAVFIQCLDALPRGSSNWTVDLVQRFQDARSENATAAVDLTYGGIGARQTRGRNNAPISFKLQIIGMMLLNKLSFGMIPLPALMQMMKGSSASYSSIHKYHFYYEKAICIISSLTVVTAVAIYIMSPQLRSGAAPTLQEL